MLYFLSYNETIDCKETLIMKLTTVALSTAFVIATTATAFATCNGKQRISCAEGSIYDHNKGTCVSTDVTTS